MQRFFVNHPEWQATAPLSPGFNWKWYFAFQQLGDESVGNQVQAYRDGLLARQTWTERLGWVLPGVGAQAALHRAGETDLLAQLAYQDQITAFHRQIRHFYYAYLFSGQPFGTEDFAKQPSFRPRATQDVFLVGPLCAMFALAGLACWAGIRRLDRLHPEG